MSINRDRRNDTQAELPKSENRRNAPIQLLYGPLRGFSRVVPYRVALLYSTANASHRDLSLRLHSDLRTFQLRQRSPAPKP